MVAELSPVHVLLVEDDDLIRPIMAEALVDEGFQVTEACSADEAIQKFQQSADFDVVLTDIRIPGKTDGFGVAAWARTLNPVIPLIISTGYAEELADRLRVFDPPAVLLSKPYKLERVVKTIKDFKSIIMPAELVD